MLDVEVLGKYRIVAENLGYTIYNKRVIDPTKAPGFKPEEGKSAEKREEWKSMEKYPSSVTSALKLILEMEIRNSDCKELHEVIDLIKELEKKFDVALGGN